MIGPTADAVPAGVTVLALEEWRGLADAHERRVRGWTEPYRDRRARDVPHPVHDFLFRYYRYSMAKLAEWHPEVDQWIEDGPDARTRFPPPRYRAEGGVLRRDPGALRPKDFRRLGWVRDLLRATAARTPHLGCYGMHEWAMVYRGEGGRHRETAPLRLPQAEVDALVASRPIACTHFDAFRFFTPSAKPLNRARPTPENRDAMEQPGCVHANMDVYKWAYKSMPWIGSDLLWRTFELALELRALDMRASPYDLRALGYQPVLVETEEGRARYQEEQRTLAERAQELRGELAGTLDRVLEGVEG